jgi:hypothetical protein
MIFLIYNLLNKKNIHHFTVKNDGQIQNTEKQIYHILKKSDYLQKSGMLHQKVLIGTDNTVSIVGKIKNQIRLMFVEFAKILSLLELPTPMFAHINVFPKKEETQVLTMNKEYVHTAKIPLQLINTQRPKVVRDSVMMITDLKESAPTYNLTIADDHEYFANDILTHNSDAFLYVHNFTRAAWYTAPKVDPTPMLAQEFNAKLSHDLFARRKSKSIFGQTDFALPNYNGGKR